MKSIVGLIMVMVITTADVAGQNLFTKLEKTVSPYYRSGMVGISLNQDQDLRHSLFSYKPLKFNNEQVVSLFQDQGNQDIVYYVNPHGITEYKSYGSTSPMNLNSLFAPKRDSFNPYGVKNPIEGVVTGVLNAFFQRRIDLFRRKKN